MLSNYREEKKEIRYNTLQMQLTTGITKSTGKSVKLLKFWLPSLLTL